MSVIITGMKMPKSCPKCPIIQYDDYAIGCPFHCPLANVSFEEDDYYSMKKRHKKCPLVWREE